MPSFEETLSLDDQVEIFRQPLRFTETLSFTDVVEIDRVFELSQFTESLSLSDAFTGEIFVPSNPDFKIQHSTFDILDGSTTGTITSVGSADFDDCQEDNCFIMHISTRQHGMGAASGSTGITPDRYTTYISDDSGLTSDGTVTFERAGTTSDNRIAWQIIEYIGPAGGANEMIVLDRDTCTFGASSDSCTGTAIPGGAQDDDDVAVIITGVYHPENVSVVNSQLN